MHWRRLPARSRSGVCAALILAMLEVATASPILAQSAPPSAPRADAQPAVGDRCYSQRRLTSGVFILDACGRLYCRPKADRDIIEVIPDFARRAACTWTVVARLCKCVRNAPPDQPGGKKG